MFLVNPLASHAHVSKREEMTGAGCVFFGHDDATAELDGGDVASDGAAFHDVPFLRHDAWPYVEQTVKERGSSSNLELLRPTMPLSRRRRRWWDPEIDGGPDDL